MVDMKSIKELATRIAREFKPERIVLFGSYAYGTPHKFSDVDLLVVLPFRGNPLRKSVEILTRVDPRFPVDLLARTPAQVRRRLQWGDFLLREVFQKGRVLYEAPHS